MIEHFADAVPYHPARPGQVFRAGRQAPGDEHQALCLERRGLVKYVDLTARIQNLLNESYQEVRGSPALGITGIGGVRVAFE